MSSMEHLAFAPASEPVPDTDLRALVIDTMQQDPEASFEQISTRLRARAGRVIPDIELQRLQTIYQGEGYAAQATTSRSGKAARVASLSTFKHYRPNVTEILGIAAGLVPLV